MSVLSPATVTIGTRLVMNMSIWFSKWQNLFLLRSNSIG